MTTCIVSDCEKPGARRGWCHMHYRRWRLYGSTDLPAREYATPATCTAPGCTRPGRNAAPDTTCWTHYQRMRRHGSYDDPRPATTERCAYEGCPEPPRTRVGDWCAYHYDRQVRGLTQRDAAQVRVLSTYAGAHARVRAKYGPASARSCAMGCGAQAEHWAFAGVPTSTRTWSPDPDLYSPLCARCHKNLDTSLAVLHEPREAHEPALADPPVGQ